MAEKDKLIKEHLYIARYLAHRYSRSGVTFDDLYQEGCIGLLKAETKFKPELGFKFSTYATWWVRQAILSSITFSSRTVRLPSHIVQLKLKIHKFSELFLMTKGTEPTNEEIATELGITKYKVKEILALSLEVDIEDFETFITSTGESVLDNLDKEEEHAALVDSLSSLTLKERVVVGLKFGLLHKIK